MIRGTKPKPTALKLLEGTFRQDRANPNEPTINPLSDCPPAPDWLNEWAKQEWYVVAGYLTEVKLLTNTDKSIVAAYCQQMGVYREAENALQTDGRVTVTDKGYQMPSPWVAIGNRALMQAMKIAAEYGLTPSSRSRIQMPAGEEEDEFERLLREN